MKKELKNMKGITLIALVITIIVLLILAGVSIAMLTGDNGILTQANKAKTETEYKGAEEKVKLAIMAARSQSERGTLDAEKLVTEVTTNYGGQAETTAGGFPVTVTIDGKSFIVSEDGTIESAGAKPQITDVKIVTNSDGTGEDVPDNQSAENTVLYISFKTSLENGTINSVNCDNGTVENKNGIYVTKITGNGTYTFTIIGTGENGSVTSTIPIKVNKYETKIVNASDIASMSDKSKIYGATVKGYELPSGTTTDVNWKIFYADENNIYLIADNYVERENLPNSTTEAGEFTTNKPNDGSSSYPRAAYFSNILGDYAGSARITDSKLKALNNSYFNENNFSSTNSNMKSVAYMMDTKAWNSKFKDVNNRAEYVIGGPTVEMLMKSYSQKYKVNYQARAKDTVGYEISKDGGVNWDTYYSGMLKTSDSLYVINSTSDAYAMWVASPSAYSTDFVMNVNSNGSVNNTIGNLLGFRPLVSLKSDIQLQKNADGTYTIL